ncbi:MAG: ABC transporter substrate-binding protein [Candidatus Schekmanbacteria bacterium]|nr:ABC transporter substrate-binding protein [Candidatus Schekmanbacteria bacterium]
MAGALLFAAGCQAKIIVPTSPVAKAKRLVADRRGAEAITLIQEHLATHPGDEVEARAALAAAFLQEGDITKAVDQVDMVERTAGNRLDLAEILFAAGQALVAQAPADNGIALLDRSARMGEALRRAGSAGPPTNLESVPWKAYLLLSETLIKLGRDEEAAAHLQRLLGISTDGAINHHIRYLLGYAEYRRGNLGEAAENLRKAAYFSKSAPTEEAILVETLLGQTILRDGKPLTALDHFLRALRLGPTGDNRTALTEHISGLVRNELSAADLQTLLRTADDPWIHQLGELALVEELERRERYDDAEQAGKQLRDASTDAAFRAEIERVLQRIVEKKNVDPWKIGFIGPLTGPLGKWGEQVLAGIQLAFDEFNRFVSDRKAELVVADSRGETKRVPDLVAGLVRDHRVIAILGPVLSQSVREAAPIAAQLAIPLLSPSAVATGLGDTGEYVFRNTVTNKQQADALAAFATQTLRLRAFAILHPDTAMGRDLAELFRQAVVAAGGDIVADESYGDDETDFRVPLLEIRGSRPDALFIPDAAERAGLIAPQVRFHDMRTVVLMGPSAWNSEELVKVGGEYVEGCFFVDGFFVGSKEVQVQSFVRRFQEKHFKLPDRLAAQAFDAAKLILSRIAEGHRTRDALRRAILATKDFPGISGETTFGTSGDAQKRLHVLSVEHGRLVELR